MLDLLATYTQNLRDVVAQASTEDVFDGLNWYADAWLFATTLADTMPDSFGTSRWAKLQRAAGVIAVLSPRQSWATNKHYASAVVRYVVGTATPKLDGLDLPVFRANLVKALGVMGFNEQGEAVREAPEDFVRGPKVSAFYANITGDMDVLTLDTHAINAARGEFNPKPKQPSPSERNAMLSAYQCLAAEMGTTPAQAQAVVWVTWRHMHHGNHAFG